MGRKHGHIHLRSVKHNQNMSNKQERVKNTQLAVQAQEKETVAHPLLMEHGGHRSLASHPVSEQSNGEVYDMDPIRLHFGASGMAMPFTAGVEDTQSSQNLARILDEACDYGEWEFEPDMEQRACDNTVSNVTSQLHMMGETKSSDFLAALTIFLVRLGRRGRTGRHTRIFVCRE